ncbi:MAG: flagellin-like protein [Oscillospiraceae bacterium]|nr:flagellin-like protein [Oscillospiraceae bacterium]
MLSNLKLMALSAKCALRRFFTKENGDVNVVSIVVLIGIAVVLAIIFRDAIYSLIEDLLDTIRGNAEGAIANGEGGGGGG